MKARTHLLWFLAVITIVIYGAWPVIARAELPPLPKGELVQSNVYGCSNKEDAVDVAVKEIADGMEAAIALFNGKPLCAHGHLFFTAVQVVATAKNASTTTYVIEVETDGVTLFVLSKVNVVAKKDADI